MPVSLRDFLAGYAVDDVLELHAIHSTPALLGLKMAEARQANPTKCKVYKKKLLYLFYGRPAYKPLEGLNPTTIEELFPTCFIFRPAVIEDAVRIMPFDSGGYELYRSHVGPLTEKEEFELGTDPTMPRRVVKAFFGDANRYYDQLPALRADGIQMSKLTARAYARLLADESIRLRTDDRVGTVEIQLAKPVKFKEHLRAIIGPHGFMSDPEILTLIKETDAIPRTYKTYGAHEPAKIAQHIYPIVEELLFKEGGL